MVKKFLTAMLVTALLLCAVASFGVTQLQVPLYGQCWSPWSSNQLGTCALSICDAGCAISSVSMVMSYYGVMTDPDDLNSWLTTNGGYANGCSLYWAAPANHSGGKVTWAGGGSGFPGDAAIKAQLDAGYPVVVLVYPCRPSCTHYIVITGYDANGTYYINDPGYGDQTTFQARYGAPKTGIHQWEYYHGTAPTVLAGPVLCAGVSGSAARNGCAAVFYRSSTGSLCALRKVSPTTWGSHEVLGGWLKSAPTMGQNSDGRLEVFFVGSDDAIWHRWENADGTMSDEVRIGGAGSSAVAVSHNQAGRMEIFYRGTDGTLYTGWRNTDDTWAIQNSLGGNVTSRPAVVYDTQTGCQEAYFRGASGDLWYCYQTAPNGSWSSPSSLGGYLSSAPSVRTNIDGRREVYYRGANGHLCRNYQTAVGGGWNGQIDMGGIVTATPFLSNSQNGALEVFYRSNTGSLCNRWQGTPGNESTWSGENQIGGYMRCSPVAIMNTAGATGCEEVFYRGSNGGLWNRWQLAPNSGWSTESSLGGYLSDPPIAL